jgi:4-alpha-glucanotransferase
MTDFHRGRHAGVVLPLFSATTGRSWGIGEILDLVPLCGWLRQSGFDVLQLLPINEMSPEHSPYSAITAMAIDPVFLSLWDVEDFVVLGGDEALSLRERAELEAVRHAPRVEHGRVRVLKFWILRAAFSRFLRDEWAHRTGRARDLHAFMEREAWWLDDYALFRALRHERQGRPWWEWETALASRDAAALSSAGERLHLEVLFRKYLQWLCDQQWRQVVRDVSPVGLFGDLPFVVGGDSADVWARQHVFDIAAEVGAPPDAFSETGQSWGLPAYRWDVMASERDEWIRLRARRSAALFAGYRVDHLVGFYRTYVIPKDGAPRYFVPEDEADQRAQGERVLRAFAEPGARVIAEDLGTIPAFVRVSLNRLRIPGFRVLRWERAWEEPGQPFRDPATWPAISVATTGTHDTESLPDWWEATGVADRAALEAVAVIAASGITRSALYSPRVGDTLLELMYRSGSDLLLLPFQDLFGWRDRINTPATLGAHNWTWRMPWRMDDLATQPEARERAVTLARWARESRRVEL